MALSNWDTLAINGKGESSIGECTFSSGTNIEIYKNWCYISNEKMWVEGGGFTSPVIAQFIQGEINIGGVQIKAARNRQDAIFLFASKGYRETLEIFAGIGCSGYADRMEEYLELKNINIHEGEGFWGECWSGDKTYLTFHSEGKELERIEVEKGFDLNPWVGVEKETLDNFKNWLSSLFSEYDKEEQKWLSSIKWDELLRFNQGDMFFAENLGIELPASEVGTSEEPVMTQFLKEN